jgi:K(+)-stimulated pyrophosphate-energized sodium pump
MENLLMLAPAGGAIALLFAVMLTSKIKKADPGTEKMVEISSSIHEGAMAFLERQYSALAFFVILVFAIIGFLLKSWPTAVCFLAGALCSAGAGYIGMKVATQANVRTANAARKSQNEALGIAFSGGAVMGMAVSGLGLLGLGILYYIYREPTIVNGFALGGSSIALFGRVGGGIYTKAADVGADLVGKVEAGIPEDDPRNPATIADNVGDNVGDVAGMGADLFESYVGSIIAAMTLGIVLLGFPGVLLPMIIAAGGIIASIVGTFFVRTGENSNPLKALNTGTFTSAGLLIVIAFVAVKYILPSEFNVFWALVAGLVVGTLIGLITEYYTSDEYKPVQGIAKASVTGPATTIIAGLGVGMTSTFLPIVCISIAVLIAYFTGGIYGIALAAVGMLATTGMVVAVDAYGPIADNAGGIAEMAELPKSVRETTDRLDSVGNTTAAIGKGFAIGSAALTALALLTAFSQVAGIQTVNLLNPKVIVGAFIGAMLPFLFCAMTMGAVGRAASEMVEEVRRQFREISGLMEGKAKPDYARCVDISTRSAIKEMVLPGLMAVVAPVVIGLLLGSEALAGMLAGALISGVCLAIMLANAGGAWDNAKKFIEKGNFGGKGSEAHAAGVVGDTVGDPCKDTSGPSLNILLKLMTIVSLVFAPLFL